MNLSRKISSLIDEIRIQPSNSTSIVDQPQLDDIGVIEPDQESLKNSAYGSFKENFVILVVDDVEENCQILFRYLKKLNYEKIYIAHDGIEALKVIKENKIDLILLDIVMPNMNGFELLTQLRAEIRQNHLMVLMITGSDTLENDIKAIKLGAIDVLSKPFNVDLLQARIGTCLERKWFINKELQYRKQIELDKEKYQELINAIFPSAIADELIRNNQIPARVFPNVAVLFADVVGFTNYCNTHELDEIIRNIQDYAEICERAVVNHNLQKIKTIGDGFLAISGLLTHTDNAVLDCIKCTQDILEELVNLEAKWKIRIGIDYGTVIGGVVGHRQYLYDVWSDTVNTASRIQELAKPNTIYLSPSAYEQVKEICYCGELGEHKIKGKDNLTIFKFEKFK